MKIAQRLMAALTALLMSHLSAEGVQPDTLLHAIPAPFTTMQSNTLFANSVAFEGAYTVVGAPQDDIGASDSGVVKVFDTATGALLHVIANPSPAQFGNFGYSVAISGTRVVVGAHNDNTGASRAGSAYVYDLGSGTPTVPVATLNNPSPAANDGFGFSVAISGTRVVVGANSDDMGATNAGSAYVYDLGSGTPTVPVATLSNPSPANDDNFGWSVAISAMRVVVGANYDDQGAINAGSAYVYDLGSGTPTVPVATLSNPSLEGDDNFGFSVAISGLRVAVGAPLDDTGATNDGSVYLYDLGSGTPTVPVVTLNNPSPALHDRFGNAVAISGTRVLVGEPFDSTGASQAGSAYVYDLGSGTPTVPVATLNNPGPAAGDNFGFSVAISGPQVVVGAYFDDTGATDAGSAYVYDLGSGTPTVPVVTLNNPSPTANDRFGNTIAISGTLVVVGAPSPLVMGTGTAGNAYVYDLASPTPTVPVVTLNNPSPATGDQFGYSVAISGTRVVIGANLDDTGVGNSGSAYVYDLGGATPTVPVVTLNNPSLPAVNNQFGNSVAISGTRVVVGAALDDSGASNSGRAYVYDLGSGTPTVPVAILNNPSPASNDQFGFSVAISGARVVIGANLDDTGASNAGSVYVYDMQSGTPTVPVETLNNPSIPAAGDQFGWSVAISGTRVVVGANADDTGASDAGCAFVYDLGSGTPTVPTATLNNPNPASGDQFGNSVSISWPRVVVGASFDDAGATDAGSAYLYDLGSGTPTVPVATLNKPGLASGDQFGTSVAIDDRYVAIGTPLHDVAVPDKGVVHIFAPERQAPAGGSFTITPGTPAHPSVLLTGTFAGWTDASLPLTYSVRVGSTVIVPPGSNAVPTFTLPEGTHLVYGRITDAAGNYVDTTAAAVVVDGTAPTIEAPVGGFTPATIVYGKPLLDYRSQAVTSDAVGVASVTQSPTPGSEVTVGTLELTLTAKDAANNQNSTTFTVTVIPADPESELVFGKGGTVPNSTNNPAIQAGAKWTNFGSPAINDAGDVAVIGKWSAPAVTGATPLPAQAGVGIFHNDSLVIKVGQAVPGAGTGSLPADATFKSFKDPVLDQGGHVAFVATIKGAGVIATNDSVVVSNARSGSLEVLARKGDVAPGTGGAVWKSFASVAISGEETGGTLFTGNLLAQTGAPAVTAANDSGAWWLPAGESALSKVIREGDAGFAAGETIKSFQLLNALSGSAGHGRGFSGAGSAHLRVTLTSGIVTRQAQVRAETSALTELTGQGELIGSSTQPAAIWKSMGLPACGNGGSNLSVLGKLLPGVVGVMSANSAGIFASEDGGESWEPVIRVTDPAPSLGAGVILAGLRDPVNAGDSAGVAFAGTIKGGTVLISDNDTLWWKPAGGAIRLIAREGAQPPDAPEGAKWKSFTSLALPGGKGGPIFTATLQRGLNGQPGPGGITSADDLALYGVDSLGTLHELLRENQLAAGKTVKAFNVLKAASGSVGSARAFNAKRRVVALVNFTDGTNGIVKVAIP